MRRHLGQGLGAVCSRLRCHERMLEGASPGIPSSEVLGPENGLVLWREQLVDDRGRDGGVLELALSVRLGVDNRPPGN